MKMKKSKSFSKSLSDRKLKVRNYQLLNHLTDKNFFLSAFHTNTVELTHILIFQRNIFFISSFIFMVLNLF